MYSTQSFARIFCRFSHLLSPPFRVNMGTTKGVRVASGNLCEAEAPTEAAAETLPRIAAEGLLQTADFYSLPGFIMRLLFFTA